MSRTDLALIFGVIVGISLVGATGIFILSSESSDDFDVLGFDNTTSSNTGFIKLNYTSGVQKFSSFEDLKNFLINIQKNKNTIFTEFFPLTSDNFVLEESLELAVRSIETREATSVPEPEPELLRVDQAKFTSGEDTEYSEHTTGGSF